MSSDFSTHSQEHLSAFAGMTVKFKTVSSESPATTLTDVPSPEMSEVLKTSGSDIAVLLPEQATATTL